MFWVSLTVTLPLEEVMDQQQESNLLKKEVEMAIKAKEVTVMRYANSEKEVIRQRKELENSEKQIKNLIKETENLNKKNKVLSSERERLMQMVDSKVRLADSFKVQLHRDEERIVTLQSECDQLRQCNSELHSDIALCRGKEAELLAYTQKVTEKNVLLQSEFSSTEGKSTLLEEEKDRLRVIIKEQVTEKKGYEKSVSQERKCFLQEKKLLLNKLETQKSEMNSLQERLDEAVGEVLVLKKKHETTLRELTKELQIAMRLGKEGTTSGDGISQSSRTSSSSSLNNIEANHQKQKNHENTVEAEISMIPDQQLLIERIVKLQRLLAKKQDKIEFVQEHNKQLVDAFQKKCKIIQCYVMNQDSGALSTTISDQNKAEVVKHGGIMASLYGSKPSDEGLTLELSLEINRKLQAVLEDTLLKNITLKENINTLGKEISNLIESNRKLMDKVDKIPT